MNNTTKSSQLSHLTIAKIILISLSIISIIAALVASYTIYSNNKTDGLNNGQISVDSCSEIDWSWRIYSCEGSYFSTGGGMISRDNVTVKVFGGELKEGEVVEDVYPPDGQSAETTNYFVTGRERASVTYNIQSIVVVFVGILLPILTGVFIFVIRKKTQ